MRKRTGSATVLSALLLLGAQSAAADTHVWSRLQGGTNSEDVFNISANAAGAVAITGHFFGTTDFGGGPMTSAGGADIFVAVYDALGNHVWSKRLGSTGADAGKAVFLDNNGMVFLTGYFEGTADFGGGPKVSNGGFDAFLVKYGVGGTHVWSQNYGNTSSDGGEAIALDALGNVYFTGYFSNSIDFGGGSLSGLGGIDIFLVKYDSSLNHVWSVPHGGPDVETGWKLACAGGDVVLAGFFQGTTNLGGNNLTSAGDYDIYLAKYDTTAGAHLWSQHFGGTQEDWPAGLAIDSAGRIALGGHFYDTVDFGGGPRVSVDGADAFLAQYDAAGNHQWSQGFGGVATDKVYGVAVDGADQIVITGGFLNSIDFGGGVLTKVGSFDDVFLARFDANGAHIWSDRFGSVSFVNTDSDLGRAIAVDGNDFVVFAGVAEDDIDFGGGLLLNQRFYDVFVTKFRPPGASAASDAPNALALHQNHPNPFNPSTRIEFSLPSDGHVQLVVYDVSGRLVRTLVDGRENSGPGAAVWDGRDNAGAPVSSGVYFYRLRAAGDVVTSKMVLLK